MSMNLLASAESYLSHDVVEQISNRLGENPRDTQTGINGALPTVLGGLIQKSTEPGGPGTILDMVGQVMTPNRAAGEVITSEGGVFSQLGSMFDGSGIQMSQFLAMGSGLITNLFGNRTDTVAGALATHSGVRQASASALLSLAGPVVLGVLGKQLATDGDGPSGLATLLAGQVGNVQAAMPPELGSMLGAIPGMTTPGDLGSRLTRMESGAGASPAPPILPAATTPADRPAAGIPAYSDDPTAGSGNRWLPWLLLAAGAAALFFFLRGCGNDRSTSGSNSADTTSAALDADTETRVEAAADSAGSAMGAAADSVGSAMSDGVAALGAFFKRKLPSGYELNIPENGIENNLVRFIEDRNKAIDKTTWFNFDRLLFDTGKATLKPASKEQVNNIAEVLKAYPAVAIKLGGYTDNTGNAQANVTLSGDRAKTVMNALVDLGIDKARLEAEGYGAQFPVASNETEAGRAQNRRIAVRVTKR